MRFVFSATLFGRAQKAAFASVPLSKFATARSAFAGSLALAALFSGTVEVAHQDVSDMLASSGASAWTQTIERSPAGSTHAAQLSFATDSDTTGSVVPFGVNVPGIGEIAAEPKGKGAGSTTPDELRVNRTAKTDRLVRIVPVAPPAKFSAGSVLQRTSSLIAPAGNIKLASFSKPAFKNGDKAIAVATAFHVKQKPKIANDIMPVAVAKLVTNDTADVLATAYAPTEPDFSKESPFEAILNDTAELSLFGSGKNDEGRFVPSIGPKDHAWAKAVLSPDVFSEKEQRCLAEGIYFEARGEIEKGQAAVAQVILNRVRNPTFPNTICGVVYQNITWFNRCQFSFACDRVKDRVIPGAHWETAKAVALAVTSGKIWIKDVGSSTHYHATYVKPNWGRSMVRVAKIGEHIFYRTRNGGWS
jgi:spore germination cell wall hydrolase CwlJ-like protein